MGISSVQDLAGNRYVNTSGDPVTVIPADTVPPVITPRGSDPLTHELGEPYADPGADADDGSAVTTDASAVDVNVAGDYTVTYTATDGNGNTGTATGTVQVRDTTLPQLVSGELDLNDGTLTLVFDEVVDVSSVHTGDISVFKPDDTQIVLDDSTADDTAGDSETVTITLDQAELGLIGDADTLRIRLSEDSVADLAGNGIADITGTLTVIPAAGQTPEDTTPPTLQSATLDLGTGILTIVFDEAIDFSGVDLTDPVMFFADGPPGTGDYVIPEGAFDGTAPDSAAMPLTLPQSYVDTISGFADPALLLITNSVLDVAGNGIERVTVPITLADETPEQTPEQTPAEGCRISNGGDQDWRFTGPCGESTPAGTPVIATVTLTADRQFENSGDVELAKSGLMAFSVDFANGDDTTRTILADLTSYNAWHAGADIVIPAGTTATVGPFIVDGSMQPGDTAYLVYGVADDPGTPEREPDTVLGDMFLKIRIIDPVSYSLKQKSLR